MKRNRTLHRTAILALSASIALPIAPVFGQDAPASSAPPVVSVSPPPPVISAPPPATTAPAVPAPRIDIVPQSPPVARAAPPPAVDERPAPRAARAAPARTRAAAPARRAPAPAPVAQAPAAAPEAAAPLAQTPFETLPPPVAAEPAPVPIPVETETGSDNSLLMALLIGGGALLLAALVFFGLRRRRVGDEVDEDVHYEEPAPAAAEPGFSRPVEATPVVPVMAPAPDLATPIVAAAAAEPATAEEVSIDDADQADVDALAADSAPVAGRPWLEFLLRPVRAGTSQDDAIVQFELTVGNTGTVSAEHVRISTWMFAAGAGTDMERSLIEPPADATVSEIDIAAGDGARVDGEIALSKAGLHEETVLPVVVADARYRLPDGSEGRTSASFAVGLPGEGDSLAPFQLDRATGLIESVEARLHGEPTRV